MIRALFLIVLLLAQSAWSSEARIAVLLSDTEAAYEAPLAHFQDKMKRPVDIYNLHGDIERAPALMQQVMDRAPALILALGAKAAYFAKAATAKRQDVPVIFAMVLNWQRYDLLEGQSNIAGIDSDVSTGTQLISLKLLFPEVRRIGVFFNKQHTEASIKEAMLAADLVNLEVVSQPINQAGELRQAYRRLAGKVDAIWLPTDPVLYTLENMHWLTRQCLKDKMICAGQSENIVRLGMILAVNADIPGIGVQAAVMAEKILQRGVTPAGLGVEDPLGTRVTLNAKTARKMGLSLNEAALRMADEVVE